MKAFLIGLIFITCAPTLAQSWEDEACIPTFYQPGGENPVRAADSFSVEIMAFACLMHSKIQLGKNEEMYILSYDALAGEMTYQIYDFTGQRETGTLIPPKEKICTISQQYVPVDDQPAEDGSYSLAVKVELSEPVCKTIN